MCISIFQPKPIPIVFPHPEEPQNPLQNTGNVDVAMFEQKWETDYNVPAKYQLGWNTSINIRIFNKWSECNFLVTGNPCAFTFTTDVRWLYCLAPWINAGVFGYEAAHYSYGLLTDAQKTLYQIEFKKQLASNKLMQALFKLYPGELTADTGNDSRIAGHAETYRILGASMPESLKQYYPLLF